MQLSLRQLSPKNYKLKKCVVALILLKNCSHNSKHHFFNRSISAAEPSQHQREIKQLREHAATRIPLLKKKKRLTGLLSPDLKPIQHGDELEQPDHSVSVFKHSHVVVYEPKKNPAATPEGCFSSRLKSTTVLVHL